MNPSVLTVATAYSLIVTFGSPLVYSIVSATITQGGVTNTYSTTQISNSGVNVTVTIASADFATGGIWILHMTDGMTPTANTFGPANVTVGFWKITTISPNTFTATDTVAFAPTFSNTVLQSQLQTPFVQLVGSYGGSCTPAISYPSPASTQLPLDCGSILPPDAYTLHVTDIFSIDNTAATKVYVTAIVDSFAPVLIAKNDDISFTTTFTTALQAGYVATVTLTPTTGTAVNYTTGSITGTQGYQIAIALNDLSSAGAWTLSVTDVNAQVISYSTTLLKVYDISSLSKYSSAATYPIDFLINFTETTVDISNVYMIDSLNAVTEITIVSTVSGTTTVTFPNGIPVIDAYHVKTVDSQGGALTFSTVYILTMSVKSVTTAIFEVGTAAISFTITFSSVLNTNNYTRVSAVKIQNLTTNTVANMSNAVSYTASSADLICQYVAQNQAGVYSITASDGNTPPADISTTYQVIVYAKIMSVTSTSNYIYTANEVFSFVIVFNENLNSSNDCLTFTRVTMRDVSLVETDMTNLTPAANSPNLTANSPADGMPNVGNYNIFAYDNLSKQIATTQQIIIKLQLVSYSPNFFIAHTTFTVTLTFSESIVGTGLTMISGVQMRSTNNPTLTTNFAPGTISGNTVQFTFTGGLPTLDYYDVLAYDSYTTINTITNSSKFTVTMDHVAVSVKFFSANSLITFVISYTDVIDASYPFTKINEVSLNSSRFGKIVLDVTYTSGKMVTVKYTGAQLKADIYRIITVDGNNFAITGTTTTDITIGMVINSFSPINYQEGQRIDSILIFSDTLNSSYPINTIDHVTAFDQNNVATSFFMQSAAPNNIEIIYSTGFTTNGYYTLKAFDKLNNPIPHISGQPLVITIALLTFSPQLFLLSIPIQFNITFSRPLSTNSFTTIESVELIGPTGNNVDTTFAIPTTEILTVNIPNGIAIAGNYKVVVTDRNGFKLNSPTFLNVIPPGNCLLNADTGSYIVPASQGLYSYQLQCVTSCPLTYLPDPNSICSNDDSTLYIDNGSLVKACSAGKIANQNRVCVTCQENGLLNSQGTCVIECPDNYIDNIHSDCVTCETPGLVYDDRYFEKCTCDVGLVRVNGICTNCKLQNKYVFNNSCTSFCPLNSVIDLNLNTCTICADNQDGNTLMFLNQCVPSCNANTLINSPRNTKCTYKTNLLCYTPLCGIGTCSMNSASTLYTCSCPYEKVGQNCEYDRAYVLSFSNFTSTIFNLYNSLGGTNITNNMNNSTSTSDISALSNITITPDSISDVLDEMDFIQRNDPNYLNVTGAIIMDGLIGLINIYTTQLQLNLTKPVEGVLSLPDSGSTMMALHVAYAVASNNTVLVNAAQNRLDQLKSSLNNMLDQTITYNTNNNLPNNILLTGSNIKVQAYDSFSSSPDTTQKDISDEYDLSWITFNSCEDMIRKTLNISSNVGLPVKKIDYYDIMQPGYVQNLLNNYNQQANATKYNTTITQIPDIDSPLISLNLYNPKNGTSLNISRVCPNQTMQTTIPIGNKSLINMTLYNQWANQSVNILNADDPFYTDICNPFTNTTNGTDVTRVGKMEGVNPGVVLNCSAGCTFAGITQNVKVNCTCQAQDTFHPKSNSSANAALGLDKSNYKVIFCYKRVFNPVILIFLKKYF